MKKQEDVYEWRPFICDKFNGISHLIDDCKMKSNKVGQQQWKPKKT